MTEQELAAALFTQQKGSSSSSASIITGRALADSDDGQVLITVDNSKSSGEAVGITIPTTLTVNEGEQVVITLYGSEGSGKKGYVSGIIGESSETDIRALRERLEAAEAKINEVIGKVNDRGFQRLYRWTGSQNSQCSVWYQKLSGLVVCNMRADGMWTAGNSVFNSSSPLPAALRPGSFGDLPQQVNQVARVGSNWIMFFCLGDGTIGGSCQSSGNRNDYVTLTWLARAVLDYYSSISSVSSDIDPISTSRAYAARLALGDGLDVTREEFDQTREAYNEAYDVIFGE